MNCLPKQVDSHFIQLALVQAQVCREAIQPSPNPSVGCVVVSNAGQILGQGHTQRYGGPHAEIMAMRSAVANGYGLAGCSVYVTLEPCSHHGLTPPCCDAIISAGIKKVVASVSDPNPLVSGRGFERLRAAGVEVEVGEGAIKARELNIGFFSRMIRKTPWVRMKAAASLDGKTGLLNGQSKWITGDAARADGHAWRARSCAILTGIGTVLQDNPRLDVRLATALRQPHLVVVDSQLQTPLNALIFESDRRLFIYASVQNDVKTAALEARGATVIYMPGFNDKVDLAAMLRDLAAREVNEVHVEAGQKLNGSLIREGLVDELLIYMAPKLIGIGQEIASLGPLDILSDAVELAFLSSQMTGNDLRVLARVKGRDQF